MTHTTRYAAILTTAARTITTYRVRAGSLTRMYYTEYHADQMARALRLNGMTVAIDTVRLPNDALTALTVQS
jgi:hypothetical protein